MSFSFQQLMFLAGISLGSLSLLGRFLDIISFFSKGFYFYIYLVLQRWEGTEKEKVRNIDVQERH